MTGMVYPARLALDWVLIIAAFAAVMVFGGWMIVPALFVIGSRQHAAGEVGHIASHRAVGLGPRASDWLARAAFAPLAIDLAKYRSFHLAHHRAVGVPALDPEVAIQILFAERWRRHRRRDLLLDALGLHLDEALAIMACMATPRSVVIYAALVALAWWLIGPLALLWPIAGATTMLLAQRLRARTEHAHFDQPGVTLQQARPNWWRRAWYLPHGVWRHHEHHGAARLPREPISAPRSAPQ